MKSSQNETAFSYPAYTDLAEDEAPISPVFPHLRYRLFQIPHFSQAAFSHLHQTLSCVHISWLCDRNETTRHCRCEGRGVEEPVCHLIGKCLTHMRMCKQPRAQQPLFRKALPRLDSCPNWLTLYVDKHKHCAVSLNGERVHLSIFAPLQSMAAHSYCCGLSTDSQSSLADHTACIKYTHLQPASPWIKGAFKAGASCEQTPICIKSILNEPFNIQSQWV